MSIDSQSDERLWALIAWAATIVGAIVALVIRPQYKYTVYWAYLSISFFILAVMVSISTNIISLILSIIPFIGGIISEVISALCSLLIFIVWVLGVVKSYKGEYWRIPVVYEVAEKLFKIEHETYMNC
ncbi:MAG: hypothetical protein RMJ00_04520 [Nitrososphaerota archaeon]|nr:hypothetical protein [Candidatus Bathyarchaeota archaeon]MCX8162669.1 hypothetical protein [Candidatus Bathyarchaeota archaeon]MDW8061943.1 hypothetical protein [Nitrososphaerota archaeon]